MPEYASAESETGGPRLVALGPTLLLRFSLLDQHNLIESLGVKYQACRFPNERLIAAVLIGTARYENSDSPPRTLGR
jgi:hypothetical protein